ncbi:hypothetical protein L9F63_013477, partial [Diploptera punctata]
MDLHDFINPVVFLSRLFGLTPLTLVRDKVTGNRNYKLSNIWLVYSISFIIIYNVSQIVALLNCHLLTKSYLLIKCFKFVCFSNLFYTNIIEVVTLFHTKKIVIIINELSFMKSNFQKPKEKYYRISRKCTSYFSILLICATIFVTITFFNNFSLFFSYGNNFIGIVISIHFTLIMLPYFQFIHLVIVLKEKFELINSNLKCTSNYLSQTMTVIPGLIYSRLKYFKSPVFQLTPDRSDLSGDSMIKELRKIHYLLCEITEALNYVYSAQLLVITIISFSQITFCSYNFLQIILQLGFKLFERFEVALLTVYIVLFSSKYTILSWLCCSTSFEVSE